MGFEPIELETIRQAAPQCPQARQGLTAALVDAMDIEATGAHHIDLDLVAFLKPQHRNDGGRQTHGKAVSPLGYLHDGDLDAA
jgi:hypothetical protein